MLTSDAVEAVFKRLLPPEVKVVAVAIADAPADWPLPKELASAKTVRQREYIAGRWCAARTLAQLGVVGEVGRRDDRGPSWPIGVVGAITHTREVACAAAATGLGGVGIDIEPRVSAEALKDLRATAIDDAEWALLGEDPALAAALFSAKESIFKCEFPRTGKWLEFTDAKLVAREPDLLRLRLATGELELRFAVELGHAFTAITRPLGV